MNSKSEFHHCHLPRVLVGVGEKVLGGDGPHEKVVLDDNEETEDNDNEKLSIERSAQQKRKSPGMEPRPKRAKTNIMAYLTSPV